MCSTIRSTSTRIHEVCLRFDKFKTRVFFSRGLVIVRFQCVSSVSFLSVHRNAECVHSFMEQWTTVENNPFRSQRVYCWGISGWRWSDYWFVNLNIENVLDLSDPLTFIIRDLTYCRLWQRMSTYSKFCNYHSKRTMKIPSNQRESETTIIPSIN